MSNIFMEHFEKLALDSAQHKPSVWLWYVDDMFVVWISSATSIVQADPSSAPWK
jgi:hypothetical protein